MYEWNFHDWVSDAVENGKNESCPKCRSNNVKFAIHSFKSRGFNFSACCHDCKHEEAGVNKDVQLFVANWFK